VIHAFSREQGPLSYSAFSRAAAPPAAGLSALSHLHYVRFGAALTSLSRASPPISADLALSGSTLMAPLYVKAC
jgi:hypothetical protein